MTLVDDEVTVSRRHLDEALAVLDGLAYALALARRDWHGSAASVAESVARLRADLGSCPEAGRAWRSTLVDALRSGVDDR